MPAKYVLLLLILSQNTVAQDEPILIRGIGIQVKAFVVPRAQNRATEGNYRMQSNLHSAFSVGVNHHLRPDQTWDISTGLHVEMTTWNFFAHIPDNDLPGFLSTGGAAQIWNRDINFSLALPVMVIRNFHFNERGFFNVKAGVKITYNAFTPETGISTFMADTNMHFVNIFESEFAAPKGPWFSLVMGSSKNLFLKNRNILAFEVLAEISNKGFIQGSYVIDVPDQPLTRGTYAASKLRFGVSMHYVFTGKRKVRT